LFLALSVFQQDGQHAAGESGILDRRERRSTAARRMTGTLSWVQVGDLHMDPADGWLARGRLATIVDEVNRHIGADADFVFLPGDNANHATAEQYRVITAELDRLTLPFRVIPGDHDFEDGTLAAYRAGFAEACRPEVEVIAGHRCIFLDIVSAGDGGPDFRLTMHHRNRLAEELARAAAEGQVPLVFMHAYPGDLAADGEATARLLAEAGVVFVATGHTHYNELLNDGRVIYGATRSTAQIEEDDGQPGYTIVTVHDGVPSWGFKRLGSGWPFVQIVAPVDARLMTRPADPRQVPRPGAVEIVAKLFGAVEGEVTLAVDALPGRAMTRGADGLWRGSLTLAAGAHRVTVTADGGRDEIRLLVRDVDAIPRRAAAIALGDALHAIGAWPDRGIDGAQLGPNRNGCRW
jgi:hypothetical protein